MRLLTAAEYVRGQFNKGLGSELTVRHARKGLLRVLLVPSILYSEQRPGVIAIACESYGLFLWNGLNPLDAFDLVMAGFPSMIADAVSALMREVFPYRVRRRPTTGTNNKKQAQALSRRKT